jgi:hypothetical protein
MSLSLVVDIYFDKPNRRSSVHAYNDDESNKNNEYVRNRNINSDKRNSDNDADNVNEFRKGNDYIKNINDTNHENTANPNKEKCKIHDSDENNNNEEIDDASNTYIKILPNKISQFVYIIASGFLVFSSITPYFIINNDIKSLVCNVRTATYMNNDNNYYKTSTSCINNNESADSANYISMGVNYMSTSAEYIISNFILPARSFHSASLKVYYIFLNLLCP